MQDGHTLSSQTRHSTRQPLHVVSSQREQQLVHSSQKSWSQDEHQRVSSESMT